MAAIDKIYGTKAQWKCLHEYLKKNKAEALKFMYECPDIEGPLSNFPKEIDDYLLKYCDLDFVIKEIGKQYE